MSISSAEIFPYGEWPSPIAAADVARGHIRLSFPVVAGDTVWWQESRPAELGRQVVVCQGPDGISRDLLPAPWNARSRVHEYGGQSYLPVSGTGLVFTNFTDQRLYLAAPGAEPEPLAGAAGDRFADLTLSPAGNEVWCVRERHADGEIRRAIVAVPLDGSAAADDAAVRVLVSGSDFFAFPTPSPDGSKLAWICWDHPRMPWDGTELRVAPVGDTGGYRVLMGGPAESVLAPLWRDEHRLYAMSDRSGWWNLYLADTGGGDPEPLCPRDEEFAGPLWQLGTRPYALLGDGRIAVTHGTDEMRLAVLDPGTGELEEIEVPYRVFQPGCASGLVVAGLAGGPGIPLSVVTVNVANTAATVWRREADSMPDVGYLPVPWVDELTGPSGSVVHALVYPPASPVAVGPDGEAPPYIVWVHGGPTSRVYPLFDLEKAFFTSRGIGVIDVNYGGSSGYGRAYRERLRGQWGIVDVADCTAAARSLADMGQADLARLGIRGGSAGGWTALASVTSGLGLDSDGKSVFAAAVSYYGVSDLRGFAAMTHDFESRYLDGLIGPLPEAEALYIERAPVGHVGDATCPVLLLQGLDDPVVPPAQAESIAADLAAHGIRYAYLAFSGESHGFRRSETIVACLEAELSFYGQIMGFTPPGVTRLPLEG